MCGWTRLGLRDDDGQRTVLVCDFRIGRIDVVRQGKRPLKATERSLVQVIGTTLCPFSEPLVAADSQRPPINRDLDVLSLQSRKFGPDDDRVSSLPDLSRQEGPLRELCSCTRTLTAPFGTCKSRERTVAAGQELAPPFGQTFPGTRNASLQLGSPLFDRVFRSASPLA